MPLTGDFDPLRQLQADMERVSREGADYAAARCAKEVEKMTRGQFRRAQSPDGEPWAPRKADGKKALRTGAEALVVSLEGRRITASFPSKPHLIFHERGTRRMVARVIVPLPGQPLPERWQRRINGAGRWAVYHILKKQRQLAQAFLDGAEGEE